MSYRHPICSARHGQALISVLVTASLMAISFLGFLQMSKYQSRSAGQITGVGAVADLSQALTLLLNNPNCATTGNYATSGTYASITGSLNAYSLTLDTIGFDRNTPLVSTDPATTSIVNLAPFTIAAATATRPGLTLTQVPGLVGSTTQIKGVSYNVYPMMLTVSFTTAAGVNTPPPKPLTKFVDVYTDTSGNVQGMCYGPGSGPTLGTQISNCALYYEQASGFTVIASGATNVVMCPAGTYAITGTLFTTNAAMQSSYPIYNANGQPVGWGGDMVGGGITPGCGTTTRAYTPAGYTAPLTLFCGGYWNAITGCNAWGCSLVVATCCQ